MEQYSLNYSLLAFASEFVGYDYHERGLDGIQISPSPEGGAIFIASDPHVAVIIHDKNAIVGEHDFYLRLDLRGAKKRRLIASDKVIHIDKAHMKQMILDPFSKYMYGEHHKGELFRWRLIVNRLRASGDKSENICVSDKFISKIMTAISRRKGHKWNSPVIKPALEGDPVAILSSHFPEGFFVVAPKSARMKTIPISAKAMNLDGLGQADGGQQS